MAALQRTTDADVAAALPIIGLLLELHGTAKLSWKAVSNRDGYAVAEIPPMPELGLPVPCYRTQFSVHATVDALHRVLTTEASIREYDCTMSKFCALQERQCNKLLYISYTSPSPWIVAPRDFCIWSSAVLADTEQLARANPKYAHWSSEVLQSPVLSTPTTQTSPTGDGAGTRPAPLVYFNGSMNASAAEASAVVLGWKREKALVRGIIHCYGYVAVPDAAEGEGTLRVTNYCCVDPAGQLPKWIVAAAVDNNTEKLRKLSTLVEAAAAAEVAASTAATKKEETKKSPPQARPLTATPEADTTPPSARTERDVAKLATPEGHTHDVEQSPCVNAAASPPRSPDPCPQDNAVSTAAPSTVVARAPVSPPVQQAPLHPAAVHDGESTPIASASRRAVTVGASLSPFCASAVATTPQHAAPHSPVAEADLELLALLARSPAWQVQREVAEVQYAELHTLSESVGGKNPLCVALRVSCSIHCSLETLVAVLHNAALAPEIDPELVRVFALPLLGAVSTSSTPGRSHATTSRCRQAEASLQRSGERSAPAEGTLFPSPHVLGGPTPTQLRHYQFESSADAGAQPWETVLQCAETELSAQRGGQLGFHTRGLPAATVVWIGTEDTTGCYRGVHADSSHHPMRVRLFALTAVAVPRSAGTVRVSQYMLFHPDASPPPRRKDGCGPMSRRREARAVAKFRASVAAWMEGRTVRLRRLGAVLQRRHDRCAVLPLDKEPLLYFLYNVHCKHGGAALDSAGATLFNDVLAHSVPWSAEPSSNTKLLVLSTVFPCPMAHLRAFMEATPPRTRYAMECGLVSYDALPSPQGLSALRLQYGAASASFPWLRLAFLEGFGELEGPNVPWSTLVLSRTAVDGPLEEVQESATESASRSPRRRSAAAAHGAAEPEAAFQASVDDDRFGAGSIVCSGWVATMVNGEVEEGAPSTATSPTGGTPLSLELYSLLSTPDERFMPPPRQPDRVVVMQYLCVERPTSWRGSLDESGLPTGCAAEQAALLQRFRDAVCAWSNPSS